MLKKLSSVKSLEFSKVRRKGEIVFKDDGAKRGQYSKFVPKLLEVTGYGGTIVLSAEAYSLLPAICFFAFKINIQWRRETKFPKAANTSELFSGVSLMSSRCLNRQLCWMEQLLL